MNKRYLMAWAAMLSVWTSLVAADTTSQFPHRTKFKHVAIMELESLNQNLGNSVIVDVRSRYEFNTLHIKGAVHVPLSKEKLPAAVRDIRSKTDRPIVFYCNGTTCKKSYEAAELAMKAGVQKVFAYDAGIDAWSAAHPEHCVLLGKDNVSAGDFISRAAFKKRLITTKQFETYIDQGAAILDIRDLRQRDVALFPMRELRAPLDDDRKIAAAVADARRMKKTLLVYDKVGKQTRWFQYYLEQQGIRDYYFLDGGAEGYHESKFGKLNFAVPEQG